MADDYLVKLAQAAAALPQVKTAVGARSRMIARLANYATGGAPTPTAPKALQRFVSKARGAAQNPTMPQPLPPKLFEPPGTVPTVEQQKRKYVQDGLANQWLTSAEASTVYHPPSPRIQDTDAFRDSIDAAYAEKIKKLVARGPKRPMPMRRDVYEFGDAPREPSWFHRLFNTEYNRRYPEFAADHERRVYAADGAEDRVYQKRLERAAEQRRNSVYSQALQPGRWNRTQWDDGWHDTPRAELAWLQALQEGG